jgi:hypothetical protein
MRKPRGRGTSTETKRTTKVSTGRARALPVATGKLGAAPEAGVAAAPPRPEPTASSRARPKRARATTPPPAPAAEIHAAKAAGGGRARAAAQARRAPKPARAEGEAAKAEPAPPRRPELDWDDAPPSDAEDALGQRWAVRAEELFQKLAAHGASEHEYRADLKEGRFVWLAPHGRVSAEARAQVLCSWSRATSVVAMAWADPLVRSVGIGRIEGMPAERDDVDEEGAWRVAMTAAEASGAAYLYRVPAPHVWYFLGLTELTFSPERASFHPGTPVNVVLRALGDVRQAIESRAEPADVVRERLYTIGESLFHQAKYAYRGTDWVARLDRTGACLRHLAKRIPRSSFSCIAAGYAIREWIERDLAVELIESVCLLEDEWGLFC